jgi:hypothetical protein
LPFEGLTDPTNEPIRNTLSSGVLMLYNFETNRTLRFYTSSSQHASKIAKIACNDFGSSDFNYANARSANDMKKQFNGNLDAYLKQLSERSISSLECTGTENSIKECTVDPIKTFDTDLIEIEMECLGSFKST